MSEDNSVEVVETGEGYEDGTVSVHPEWIAEGKLPALKGLINTVHYPFTVQLECLEVSTFCPITRQPDFGKLIVEFVPDKLIVETRALKKYLVEYRTIDLFQEEIVHQVAHDLYTFMKPKHLTVTGEFNNRGGIVERVSVSLDAGIVAQAEWDKDRVESVRGRDE